MKDNINKEALAQANEGGAELSEDMLGAITGGINTQTSDYECPKCGAKDSDRGGEIVNQKYQVYYKCRKCGYKWVPST
jgi:predicted RNA-binding Zn-ribbon protein involved in translation (DUF1610 family)